MVEERQLNLDHAGSNKRGQQARSRQRFRRRQQDLQILPHQVLSSGCSVQAGLHGLEVAWLESRGADQAHVPTTTDEVRVGDGDYVEERAAEVADRPVVVDRFLQAGDVELVQQSVTAR